MGCSDKPRETIVRAWVIGKHLIDQTIVGSEIMLASEKSEESLLAVTCSLNK